MTTALERLHARINRSGPFGTDGVPIPLLTIAEFFDGNDVDGSILCNVVWTDAAGELQVPSLQQIREVLDGIAERPDVSDLRVVVQEAGDLEDWPFAEQVLVIGAGDPGTVRGWFPADYAPDDTWLVGADDGLMEDYAVPPGQAAVMCWWD